MKKYLFITVLTLLLSLSLAYGQGDYYYIVNDEPNMVSDGSVKLHVGEEVALPTPEGLFETWSTYDDVVSVHIQDGTLWMRGVSAGSCYVYYTSDEAGAEEHLYLVQVEDEPLSVSLDQTEITLAVGETTYLNATVSPANADQTIIWKTGKTNIATCNDEGKVKAVGVGHTYVYAYTYNKQLVAKCKVTVIPAPESIVLDKTSETVCVGKKIELKATVLPENAPQTVVWVSKDKSIATVSNGQVKGVSEGTCYVNAYTYDKKLYAKCKITVVAYPTSISLDKTSETVCVGKKIDLKATVLPSNALQTVVWSSSDKTIATVSNGQVKGIKEGTTYIKAYTYDWKLYAKCKITVKAYPTSITLDKTSETVCVGKKIDLKATVLPSNARQTVVWSSSDKTIATVSNGQVKGVKEGTTYIKAYTYDWKLYAKCKVTVVPYPTSISINKTSETVCVGKTVELKAIVLPKNTIQTVVWSSSDKAIATVSGGTVKGIAPGSTYIKAYTYDKKFYAKCKITVKPYPTSIVLNKTSTSVVVGKKSYLTATILPADAPQTVYWSSSDKAIATVSGGTVKGVAPGSTYIKAYIYDKKLYAKCKVTVYPAPEEVVLNKTSMTVYVGNTGTLTAKVLPEGAVQSVTYKSSDTSIATVNSSGVIKGIKVGEATVTVRTKDKTKYKKCKVRVKSQAVTGVSLNKTSLDLMKGDTFVLKATVKPSGALDKTVTWSSSNEKVAKVSSSGKVTAVAKGSATITVTTNDGGKTAKCKVTVFGNEDIDATIKVTCPTQTQGGATVLQYSVSQHLITVKTTLPSDYSDLKLVYTWTVDSESGYELKNTDSVYDTAEYIYRPESTTTIPADVTTGVNRVYNRGFKLNCIYKGQSIVGHTLYLTVKTSYGKKLGVVKFVVKEIEPPPAPTN
ncbi:MAG: Ig-like domain-containing protein [Abditibacteriota bacterium]|nr:Ig-like domain-containing protein [Abditibacteriota bacterium]